MDLNTCFETTSYYHNIAYYSHIIPTFLALFLSTYALFKTRFSKIAIVFFLFTLGFSIWLIGDLVDWVSTDYYLVYFTWSWLDYVNIVFFAIGAYFYGVLARGKISIWEKLLIVGVSVPAFIITFNGQSVTEFYQPVCEAVENDFLTVYKLYAEAILVIWMLVSFLMTWRTAARDKRIQIGEVLLAILLFFGVFSSTEYIATITNIYEINLYGLFVLPLFLIAMVFAVTNLGIFKSIRHLGTQLLIYTLIIMVGSQFLFLQNSTDAVLNGVTLIIAIFVGLVLLRNAKKELETRIKIEKLAGDLELANTRLQDLDKQKTEFIGFASHQLRSPLTAMKGYASLILEGDYGQVSDDLKKAAQIIFDSTKTLATVVDDYLNVSRIELGQMKYDFASIDLKKLVQDVVDELKPNVEKAGLEFEFKADPAGSYTMTADKEKLKQVITNVIDNSVKYTPHGKITITLEKKNGKLLITVSDTGIGISAEVIPKLFSKFSRAGNANKTNMRGTGLGLFIAKEIVTAHKGRIWVESDGEGKGSRFYVEV